MNPEQIHFIEEHLHHYPHHVMASQLGLTEIEFTSFLRKKGYLEVVTPAEISYIKESLKSKPVSLIKKELSLSDTQLSQIMGRYKLGKRVKSIHEMSEEEVILKTKWLIEERLQWTIDDTLPSKITNEQFMENGLYPVIHFATINKKKHHIYRFFSAVAYVFHLAYPNQFRPYQFSHSAETSKYFTKSVYLRELTFIIGEKMRLPIEDLGLLSNNQLFLSNRELQFYGLGPLVFRRLFQSKKEMIDALLQINRSQNTSTFLSTAKLRNRLEEINIETDICFVPGCSCKTGIEIHHIFPKGKHNQVNFSVDEVFNLIPLCPNHHAQVRNFPFNSLTKIQTDQWRDHVASFLSKEVVK